MSDLPNESLLIGLGEVAAAVVGFSLVAGILRERLSDASEAANQAMFSMRDVAEIGLGAVAASFLPLVLSEFGVAPPATWVVASAAIVLFGLVGIFFSRRRQGHAVPRGPAEWAVGGVNFVSMALLLSNIFAPGPSSGARYSAVVLLLLVVASIIFVTTAFGHTGDRKE